MICKNCGNEISNNQEYYLYLIKKEQEVLAKIPRNKFMKRLNHKRNIYYLRKIIKRISDC